MNAPVTMSRAVSGQYRLHGAWESTGPFQLPRRRTRNGEQNNLLVGPLLAGVVVDGNAACGEGVFLWGIGYIAGRQLKIRSGWRDIVRMEEVRTYENVTPSGNESPTFGADILGYEFERFGFGYE